MKEILYHAPARIDAINSESVQQELLRLLEEATADGAEGIKFVIDMADTTFMSSAGLRALKALLKKLRTVKGTLTMLNLNETLRDLLDMTGLSGYMVIE